MLSLEANYSGKFSKSYRLHDCFKLRIPVNAQLESKYCFQFLLTTRVYVVVCRNRAHTRFIKRKYHRCKNNMKSFHEMRISVYKNDNAKTHLLLYLANCKARVFDYVCLRPNARQPRLLYLKKTSSVAAANLNLFEANAN